MKTNERIYAVLPVFPERIQSALYRSIFSGLGFEEVRLRADGPVAVTSRGKSRFLIASGDFSKRPDGAIICTPRELESTFIKICDNSVFSHTSEIENGFVSFAGGFRAGICGDYSGGTLSAPSSINIRVCREVTGCADPLYAAFSGGMLICGPPGSGKTTVLRELIRKLSYGKDGDSYRVAVIDSRREISGGQGENAFDLGPNTDVIFISDRARGAQMVLRSMYPEIIAFDEIGTLAEVNAVLEAFNSGVHIITTAHVGGIDELKARPATRALLKSGTVKTVALLPGKPGEPPRILGAPYENGG